MHLSPTSKLGYLSFKKEHLTAVFFDLEKAYDITWKYGIMRDLNDFGLKGRLGNFIDNFLSNRCFKVRVLLHIRIGGLINQHYLNYIGHWYDPN